MSILETVTLYWNEFGIIYEAVLNYSTWKVVTIIMPILFCGGIVRSAYHYAKGSEIGQLNHSMFCLRFGDKMLTLVGAQDETMFKWRDGWDNDRLNRVYVPIPIGSNLLGMILDVAIFGLVSSVLFLIWPVVAFISITVGPLKICRVHNLRKKAFIANLKGETVNA